MSRTAVPAESLPRWRKLSWIGGLYFVQGFPFGVWRDLIPVHLRMNKVSLTDIGLLQLVDLPWTLKFLWAPLLDRFDRPRLWISACLAVMSALLVLIPSVDMRTQLVLLALLLAAFTTASATQDIAIDAYTIRLVRPGEEGDANGVCAAAYRVAMIVAGGALLAIGGAQRTHLAYYLGAGILLVMIPFVQTTPRLAPRAQATPPFWSTLVAWLRRPQAWAVFAFILTYKLGDSAILAVTKPFAVDNAISPQEIGLVSTGVGMAASIAGALLGGRITSRIGLFHALWSLGLLQATSNLVYAAVAAAPLPPITTQVTSLDWAVVASEPMRLAIYGASIFESFTAGLGTAAYMALMMAVCGRELAATQFAILSALFALSRTLASAAGGALTEWMGYPAFFALTFVVSLPAYALLPWVRRRLPDS